MLTLCAWCGGFISEDDREPTDKPSHGICAVCRYYLMLPVRSVPTAEVCLHGRHPGEYCEPCEAET